MEPREWDDLMSAYSAMGDQIIEMSRTPLKVVAEYHAACLKAGNSQAVSDALTLRFAARVLPLPPQSEGAWAGG